MPKPLEVAVVGAGIVGLACALALVRRKIGPLTVLEAEGEIASHQTGHNSGVIHSGLYYKPGSQKAENCRAGREALYRFCAEHGIAHERCGKLVVATAPDELPRLEELERRGRANGLSGLRRLTPEQAREIEPQVVCTSALHVPETGIVDFPGVARKVAELIQAAGATIGLGARLLKVRRQDGALTLETSAGELQARHLINCAGLQSDRVARLCGVAPDLRIVPFRGEYYDLAPGQTHLVRHLVYPVPDPRFPFLGVHFTRRIAGGVEAGPNAVLAWKREGYRKGDLSLLDAASFLSYGSFWKMALGHWRMGLAEMHRSYSKRAFVASLQRMIPAIADQALVPGGSGVRAQALGPGGKLLDDFAFAESADTIHVLNAPSPAATASLSIGERIAARAVARWFPETKSS